jgi:putative hydrolase of the HAD superfamily
MQWLREDVRNLVFDLGGVIINLSFDRTYQAFSRLSGKTVEEIMDIARSSSEFLQYETGKISSHQFREFIRDSMGIHEPDEIIDDAWNAMLLDIPGKRLNALSRLKQKYRTFLLSNTNAIHVKAFEEILMGSGSGKSISDYFETVYYSHEVGLRKPDPALYRYVTESNNLVPQQSVFFDDTLLNLESAGEAGLKTVHVTNADELFKKLDSIQ